MPFKKINVKEIVDVKLAEDHEFAEVYKDLMKSKEIFNSVDLSVEDILVVLKGFGFLPLFNDDLTKK
jgi:hypothetical protein